MGLIKTAIMSGAGIYAVNKIAKTAEHRHSSHNPNQYPPQTAQGGYWGPAPPAAPGRETRDAYYSDGQNYGDNQQPDGRYWSPQRDQRALRSSSSYPPREEYYDDRKFEEVYYQADNGNGRNDRVNPPAYGTQRDFPPQNQQGQFERRGAPSNVGDLADMAMRLVGGEEGGKMGSKLSNGREIVGKLFK